MWVTYWRPLFFSAQKRAPVKQTQIERCVFFPAPVGSFIRSARAWGAPDLGFRGAEFALLPVPGPFTAAAALGLPWASDCQMTRRPSEKRGRRSGVSNSNAAESMQTSAWSWSFAFGNELMSNAMKNPHVFRLLETRASLILGMRQGFRAISLQKWRSFQWTPAN